MVASPYDPEVHYARKQSTIWIGYKVHLTETCDEGGPHSDHACGDHAGARR